MDEDDEINTECILDGSNTSRVKLKVHRTKQNLASVPGQNRRSIFKVKPKNVKVPRPISVQISSNTVSYKGSFFTVGDIVSLVDDKRNLYYAQIRGLLQDQYYEKSAVITWLLPSEKSQRNRFDPTTYVIGPEEEIPRTLDCLEFVCHSPSEYFQMRSNSDQVFRKKPVCGYAKTSKGFRIVSLPAEEFNTDSDSE
ncbi:UNVERIFIED_CONTAM: gatad1 [Trichonephila clavipes]